MNSIEWRRFVLAELDRLDVRIDVLPSGITRLSNRHAYLMTSDLIHLTRSDLRTFAGDSS